MMSSSQTKLLVLTLVQLMAAVRGQDCALKATCATLPTYSEFVTLILYRNLHNPCNTEKPELTSIFGSSYIHTVLKLTEVNSAGVARIMQTPVHD